MVETDTGWANSAALLGARKAVSSDDERRLAANFVKREAPGDTFDVLSMLGLEDHWERG